MQVLKINNYQTHRANKPNCSVNNRNKINNISFGTNPIPKNVSSSPVLKLPVDYVYELSRDRFSKPNIFIGDVLYDDWYHNNTSRCMEILKEGGIKTVIDLENLSGKYKEQVEKAGLNYYRYPISEYAHFYNKHGIEAIKEKLIEFIKEVQKDNVYISSGAIGFADKGALINFWFNPMFNQRVKLSAYGFESVDSIESFAKEMYTHLTEEDKKNLGWSPDFEKMFNEKLNRKPLF